MRIAIFAAMDRAEEDQRLWFVVDELDALGQIDGLKDALARLRKFGGRCVLGFQSVAQVASTYGEGDAHTIVENCGNTLILRCSASEGGGTSRFASTLIGQREVRRTTLSRSSRPTELFGATTHSEHFNIEPAVMDSEIEQLPDLCGYLKFASRPEWLAVRLQPERPREIGLPEQPGHVPVPLPVPPTGGTGAGPASEAAQDAAEASASNSTPAPTPAPAPSPASAPSAAPPLARANRRRGGHATGDAGAQRRARCARQPPRTARGQARGAAADEPGCEP